jgi:succinate dehydrogenase/fumarate reductase flavoprotein subunit
MTHDGTATTSMTAPIHRSDSAVSAEVQTATAALSFQKEYRRVSLDTLRARELAEDAAALKREAKAVKGKPFSTFRTIEEFEQELER